MGDTAKMEEGSNTLKRKASKTSEDEPSSTVDVNKLPWQGAKVKKTPGDGIMEYTFLTSGTGLYLRAKDPEWKFEVEEFVEVRVVDDITVVGARKEPVSSRMAREGRTSG